MASVALLGATVNTTDVTQKNVTATPSAGDLIIALTFATDYAGDQFVSDDHPDGQGQYVRIGRVLKNASADKIHVWIRRHLIGSSVSTQFNGVANAASMTGGGLVLIRVTGLTRTGYKARRQFAQQDNQTGTPAPTFAEAALATNPVVSVVFNATNPPSITPKSGYTTLLDTGYNTPTAGVQVIARDNSETGTVITWGSASGSGFGSFALEFDASTDTRDYLSEDLVLTTCCLGSTSELSVVTAFSPAGQVVFWGGTQSIEDEDLLHNGVDPAFVLENDLWQSDDGVDAAINATRDRLMVVDFYPGNLYIFDRYLNQQLQGAYPGVLNVNDYIDPADLLNGVAAIAALPGSSHFLIMVEVFTLTSRTYQFIEVDADGVFVKRYSYINMTPSVTWTHLNARMGPPIAISHDGKEVCFIEPGVRDGQPYTGGPTVPPAVPHSSAGGMTGPWGRRIRKYDLVNEAELVLMRVGSADDKFGVGYAAAKAEIVTGSAMQALTCSTPAGTCALADTGFGPGYSQRYAVNTFSQTATLRRTYPADPECVWFEDLDDQLSRSVNWLDRSQSWKVSFQFILGDKPLSPTDYQTVWTMSAAGHFFWFGSYMVGLDRIFELETTTPTDGVQSSAQTVCEPYRRYTAEIEYNYFANTMTYKIDDVLVSTLSMTITDEMNTTERLGWDTVNPDSVADIGVARFQVWQNGFRRANAPLTGANNVTDTSGANWTKSGSLADDTVALDRFGTETGAIGVNHGGKYFWYAKYVRDFGSSRIMFVERNLKTGLARRFFLVDWITWAGPNVTFNAFGVPSDHYAYFPAIHSMQAQITADPIDPDELDEEPQFLAAGITGPLGFIGPTLKVE